MKGRSKHVSSVVAAASVAVAPLADFTPSPNIPISWSIKCDRCLRKADKEVWMPRQIQAARQGREAGVVGSAFGAPMHGISQIG